MCRSMRRVVAAGLVVGLFASVTAACTWDYDTIKMERSRFPNTLELVTGKFLRHSPEFYQWRIQNRLKRLEADPSNVALLDDLAVAYDKTGLHDKAIETALRTERLRPGRYETAANLGTFYIHAGRPDDGLPHIDRALKINRFAHFGREKYQKALVEYVLHRRQGGPLRLPVADVKFDGPREETSRVKITDTFAAFLLRRKDRRAQNEIADAVKGVLGMMKFGKHYSPVLLEALATLLLQEPKYDLFEDAKLLAARAYLKASYEAPDAPARVAYRSMATDALDSQSVPDGQRQISLQMVEDDFKRELEDARAWYADLREREISWIRNGQDPEAEFDRLYTADPAIPGMDASPGVDASDGAAPSTSDDPEFAILVVVFVSVALVIAVLIWGAWRNRATGAAQRTSV